MLWMACPVLVCQYLLGIPCNDQHKIVQKELEYKGACQALGKLSTLQVMWGPMSSEQVIYCIIAVCITSSWHAKYWTCYGWPVQYLHVSTWPSMQWLTQNVSKETTYHSACRVLGKLSTLQVMWRPMNSEQVIYCIIAVGITSNFYAEYWTFYGLPVQDLDVSTWPPMQQLAQIESKKTGIQLGIQCNDQHTVVQKEPADNSACWALSKPSTLQVMWGPMNSEQVICCVIAVSITCSQHAKYWTCCGWPVQYLHVSTWPPMQSLAQNFWKHTGIWISIWCRANHSVCWVLSWPSTLQVFSTN